MQNSAETFVESMDLVETGDRQVDADGYPDLALHRVLGGAVEGLDAEVLLDPLEEELDAPAALVDAADGERREAKAVGYEDQTLPRLLVHEADAPKLFGVVLPAPGYLQDDRLIAAESGGLVDRAGLADVEGHVALGPRNEERAGSMDTVEPGVVHVSTIHDIDASWLEGDPVKYVHVGDASLRDAYENGNRALEVYHRVQLDRGLGLTEVGPRKHRETKVDGGGVKGVHHLVDVEPVSVLGVKPAGAPHEDLGEIGRDPPVAVLVRVGQVRSRHVASEPTSKKWTGVLLID